jgi:flagellar basal-body rod modification protein FlgD
MNPTQVNDSITSLINNTNRVRYENRVTGTSELGQDAFLQLLMTQMQCQNPLEPMSNQDMIAQQAQFTTVSELQKLNASIASGNQFVQASSLIGKTVSLINPDNPEELIEGRVTEAKAGSYGIGVVIDNSEITYPMANIVSIKETSGSSSSSN